MTIFNVFMMDGGKLRPCWVDFMIYGTDGSSFGLFFKDTSGRVRLYFPPFESVSEFVPFNFDKPLVVHKSFITPPPTPPHRKAYRYKGTPLFQHGG